MKKPFVICFVVAALVLSLTGCSSAPTEKDNTPTVEPQETADMQTPAENAGQAASVEASESTTEPGRQNGERFEAVIILEGMEETVHYEHIINETLGFEMDYDYEMFVRHSEANRECFISTWDDPNNPENYLEVTHSAQDADIVAEAVREELSQTYDLLESTRELDRAGSCIYIEASVLKGTNMMADQLQMVYIIPAPDGCFVATKHLYIVESEGFGRRFDYMMNTLAVIGR